MFTSSIKLKHNQLSIVYKMKGFVMPLCVMEHPVNRTHYRNAVFRIRNILVRIRMRMRIRMVPKSSVTFSVQKNLFF
jgi:hypothetical protein